MRLVDADWILNHLPDDLPYKDSVKRVLLQAPEIDAKVQKVGRIDRLKITKCKGEGQGSCKRCNDNGIWNRHWMCFLNEIEGYEGCYCDKCTKEILKENENATD